MRDFNHSVNVLVKAYLNDTLEHDNCSACAVGNLVAAEMGITYFKLSPPKHCNGVTPAFIKADGDCSSWFDCLMYEDSEESLLPDPCANHLKAIGYSISEVQSIEDAFESAPGYDLENSLDPEWVFNGLMAVVEVLAEIHGISLEEATAAKSLFVKA